MRKTFFSLCFIAVACLTAMCFASCGDDDDPNLPDTPKATAASVSPVVYVTASTLKNFNVELKDASGNTQEITLENTVATSANDIISDYYFSTAKGAIASMLKNNPTETVRAYKLPAETLKSFPKNLSYTVTAVAKESSTIADGEKVIALAQPAAGITLNAGEFDTFSGSCSLQMLTFSSSNTWSDFISKKEGKFTRSMTLNFTAADKVAVDFTTK